MFTKKQYQTPWRKYVQSKFCDGAQSATNLVQSPTRDVALELWHHRLGHVNVEGVYTLQILVNGMNLVKFSCPTSSLLCKACIQSKQYMAGLSKMTGRGQWSNLWESYILRCVAHEDTFLDGARYFMTFIYKTKLKMCVCMRWNPKKNVLKNSSSRHSEHKSRLFGQSEAKIPFQGIQSLFESSWHREANVYPVLPKQNCVAEHTNCTIVEMVWNQLLAQNLDKLVGAQAVANEVDTQNQCKTMALDFITPEEIWSKKEALHYTHMCVWMHCIHNDVVWKEW